MIGDWFEKIQWKQPFRYVDAVVMVGVAGVAVFGAALWVINGSPTKVATEQTGYRGTGMVQLEFESELEKLRDPDANVIPVNDPPYEPLEGDVLAKDVYQNVQVLGNLTEDNFNRLMLAISQWIAPEQGCVYCHGEVGIDEYWRDDHYTKLVARRMIQMTWEINANWESHVAPTGVNCYTCHRGQAVPQYIWFSPEEYPNMGPNAMYQNRAFQEESVYASLPINAIEELLGPDIAIDSNAIQVQARSERAENDSFDYQTGTELTYSLMMHFSDSLGVNCTFCHNSRAWQDWEQSPPQRENAWYGVRMVRTLNSVYLDPLQATYPPHRLGPEGDAPKAMCMTCHQGVNKPLNGTPAVENWPELVSPDPVYATEAAAATE